MKKLLLIPFLFMIACEDVNLDNLSLQDEIGQPWTNEKIFSEDQFSLTMVSAQSQCQTLSETSLLDIALQHRMTQAPQLESKNLNDGMLLDLQLKEAGKHLALGFDIEDINENTYSFKLAVVGVDSIDDSGIILSKSAQFDVTFNQASYDVKIDTECGSYVLKLTLKN